MKRRWSSSAVTHLGPGLGTLFAIAGYALQGTEGAVMGFLVGYFLGKTIQSLVWTLSSNHAT